MITIFYIELLTLEYGIPIHMVFTVASLVIFKKCGNCTVGVIQDTTEWFTLLNFGHSYSG